MLLFEIKAQTNAMNSAIFTHTLLILCQVFMLCELTEISSCINPV